MAAFRHHAWSSRIGWVERFRFVIALCSLAAAGCAMESTAPTEAPGAPTTAVTPEPAQAPSPSRPPSTAADAEAAGAAPAPIPAPSAGPAAQAVAAAPTSPADESAVRGATPGSPSAPGASQPPANTLDFTSLGARLRTTKAIGVLTKLSVKSQADDLIEQFRDYHQHQGAATLPDLRRSYDRLVSKLLSLLQEADPPLAMDINRSRAAIWDVLSDQRKFVDSDLMAGALP